MAAVLSDVLGGIADDICSPRVFRLLTIKDGLVLAKLIPDPYSGNRNSLL